MAATLAQFTANRNNARRSTGPRTPEGKARSRANAVKHGLTGSGVALPTENATEVERRFQVLQEELGADGLLGALLAHRVALMSVRLDRSVQHETAALATRVSQGRAEFDQAREAEVAALLAAIDQGTDVAGNCQRLLAMPEGVDHLIASSAALLPSLETGAATPWDEDHARRFEALTGLVITDQSPGELARILQAEIADLEKHRATLDHAAIAASRAEASHLALFDPSPAATLARRYEAAAERSFYRALQALRQAEPDLEALGPPLPPVSWPARDEAPSTLPVAPPPEPPPHSPAVTGEPPTDPALAAAQSLLIQEVAAKLGSFGSPFEERSLAAEITQLAEQRRPRAGGAGGRRSRRSGRSR